MIPFDLTYRRAESVDEAVGAWIEATEAGGTALYYGGGTEFVTLARDNKRHADVLIDYKRVPDAGACGVAGDGDSAMAWEVGAGLRLNTIVDTPGTGLLAYCFSGVADRTVRNSITVGGNICGMLAYREGVLPFLLLDGSVTYAYPRDGVVARATQPIRELFKKKLALPRGGLALSFSIDAALMEGCGLGAASPREPAAPDGDRRAPGAGLRTSAGGYSVEVPYGPVTAAGSGPRGSWFYRRQTREPRVDYPLVTVAMASVSDSVRIAVAGAWGYPVRAERVEEVVNSTGAANIAALDEAERRTTIERAVDAQEIQFKQDMRGSRRYRRELTIQAIEDGVLALTGDPSGGRA
ncbi:MAG: FAD binding domain-containing protein [Alkalispirochaeta sp.]